MEAIATVAKSVPKRKPRRKIPEALIYEIVDGKPIYYRGYREVLNGTLNQEAIMADSLLQTWLKTYLGNLLIHLLASKPYVVLSGELGLLLKKGHRRGADIAIFSADKFSLEPHFAKTAPEVIIEIDVQAALENQPMADYVHRKIDDYLRFGVKQVIWIFTADRKVMTATPVKPWLTFDWDATIETVEGASFNLDKLLEGKNWNPEPMETAD